RGHPTCRLLATRRSLEREIPSWQLPVTFEFELEPGLEPLIAGWQHARDVRLRPLDHQANRKEELLADCRIQIERGIFAGVATDLSDRIRTL
ncbi:MAG: hypothetical protein GY696_39900, partial [Gammaproteobacteria bacterium]|nr:hypothetical protein [Gammaproteobacteria bacterium]